MDPEERELTLHPDRQGLRMVLGDLEAVIMDVIGRQPGETWCSVRDIYETLRQERPIASPVAPAAGASLSRWLPVGVGLVLLTGFVLIGLLLSRGAAPGGAGATPDARTAAQAVEAAWSMGCRHSMCS